MKDVVRVDFYGLPLEITGRYFKGEKPWFSAAEGYGNPGCGPSFDIEMVEAVDCPTVDAMSLTDCIYVKQLGKMVPASEVMEQLVLEVIAENGL